jgi:hypothetical protein
VLVWLVLKGRATQFSTSSIFPSERHATLTAHLWASLVWSVSSVCNIFLGFSKNHRMVGYVGFFSAIFMAHTATLLSLSSLSSPHLVFHALCNLQVAFVTVYLLSAGVSCTVHGNSGHGWYMRTAHVVLGMNFVPRLTAGVFRWYLGLGGETAFSVACAVQLGWQTAQIMKAPKGAKKEAITSTNLKCLTVAAATVCWVSVGTAQLHGSVTGIIIALGMGMLRGREKAVEV